jgi:uncharacterized membrane protein YvbJ
MKCLKCNFDNPSQLLFCKQCGAKMDLTADEIKAALVQQQKGEQKKATEYYMQQSLFFSILVLLAAVTLYWFGGSPPSAQYEVPSISRKGNTRAITPGVDIAPRLQRPLITPKPR